MTSPKMRWEKVGRKEALALGFFSGLITMFWIFRILAWVLGFA